MRYTQCMRVLFCFMLWMGVFCASPMIWPQQGTINPDPKPPAQKDPGVSDISSLIGLTIEELIARFGIPGSVHAVRGLESWQDDVVFVYKERDFYIYKDHVWQIAVKAAYGVKIGDHETLVSQTLGKERIRYVDDYLLFALPSQTWPLMLRISFNNLRAVSAIYIYRPDI